MRTFKLVLLSYGQFLLCNNKITGLLVFSALILVSPKIALISLLSTFFVISVVLLLSNDEVPLKSNLCGVNGALLGLIWYMLPEVPLLHLFVISGVALMTMALVMAFASNYFYSRKKALLVFSTPYVLFTWTLLAYLNITGNYDKNEMLGWYYYFDRQYVKAEESFNKVQNFSAKAFAYKFNGLGWSAFKQNRYLEASEGFKKSLKIDGRLADSYDGLGWSYLKLKQESQAQKAFLQAVSLNKFLADSWAGLGWIKLTSKQTREAEKSFQHAVFIAPFFANAYHGLKECSLINGNAIKAKIYNYLFCFTKDMPIPLFTIFDIFSWTLIFLGIFFHSRLSGIVAVFSLVFSLFLVYLSKNFYDWSFNLFYLYDTLAISIALGGHYLVLNRKSCLWLIIVLISHTLLWGISYEPLLRVGMPLLTLPFNFFAIGSLYVLPLLRKYIPGFYLAPLSIAISTPERVRIWHHQYKTLEKCWEKIENELEK